MRKILLLVILTGVGFLAKAQTNPFPSTDSLERFINRYIRNSPVEAFQNLRMNTALIGLLRYIQGSELGSGLDTAYALNDSTLRLITGEPDTLDVVLRGKPIITSARVAFGGADNRLTDDADLTYTAATNRLNTGTGNFSDSVLVGRLRDGTVSDSVVVWDNSTRALKKVAQSSIAGAPSLTTIVRPPIIVLEGDSAMGIPDTLTVRYRYGLIGAISDSALEVDTLAISTRAWRQKGDDSVAAVLRQVIIDSSADIRADFPATPTLQQVTDAGNTTTTAINADSIKTHNLRVDSNLYVPVRRATDTTHLSSLQGQFLFDTLTNNLWYRDTLAWTTIATLTNSLIPNRPNMRLAAAVIRATVTGTTVTWNYIINSQHDSIFFNSISCNGTAIVIGYPTVTKIHSFVVVPDESFAGQADVGASVGTTQAFISVKRRMGVKSAYFQGNGTTYVSTATAGGPFTLTYVAASGNLVFDYESGYVPPEAAGAVIYVGGNGYHVEREFSATGGNDRRYSIKDEGGNLVTANPTSSDVIEIVIPQNLISGINPCSASANSWEAAIFNATSNFWIIALLEL